MDNSRMLFLQTPQGNLHIPAVVTHPIFDGFFWARMALKSFIEVHPDSHFPIQNLTYGVFRVARYSGLTGRGDRGLRSGFVRDRLFRALRRLNPEELRLLLSA